MKRLRKKFSPITIRFFMCGEYGSLNDRPHYHACLFGIQFNDLVPFKRTAAGSQIFTSATLSSLWSNKGGDSIGHASVGTVDFASAGYVARYTLKKSNGRWSHLDYQEVDRETGEVYQRTKEFTRMSLKPGIGAGWYEKWKSDVYPHDYVVVNGVRTRPPRYYSKKFRESDPEAYEELQFQRHIAALDRGADNTEERLRVREHVQKAAIRILKRELI